MSFFKLIPKVQNDNLFISKTTLFVLTFYILNDVYIHFISSFYLFSARCYSDSNRAQ